jgi:D-arabinose 1-dehydrogenase-like Zn-dependent alcohol dehydrogenase
MKIAALQGPRQFEVMDAPIPEIAPDEVLLHVAACGVCTSELDHWVGTSGITYPHYPGHEVSGTVEQVGSNVQSFKPGEKVGAWVTSRGFAEYVAVKAEYCFPAGDVPLDLALAEPLACSVNAGSSLSEVSVLNVTYILTPRARQYSAAFRNSSAVKFFAFLRALKSPNPT